MEYVSILAGERFTDKPHCTHPALAGLARLVNDRIKDDAVRARLVLLAPGLIGTNTGDIRIAPVVTLACLTAASDLGGPGNGAVRRRLERTQLRLRRRSQAGRWAWAGVRAAELILGPGWTISDALQLKSAIDLGWARLRALPTSERDRWLHELLAAAVTDTRQLLELPTLTEHSHPADRAPEISPAPRSTAQSAPSGPC